MKNKKKREILCRGKRKDNGKWVIGYFRQLADLLVIYPKPDDERVVTAPVEVYDDTVGEFTGLTDKNGNRIFEGDIVDVWQDARYVNDNKHYKAVVEFGNPNGQTHWGWQLKFSSKFPYNPDILCWVCMEEVQVYCEVIGNIHDNPELLEVAK